MSGKESDLPIRSKRALFRQKKLDRINFKSGKRGRVIRNPPGVTTGQWVIRSLGHTLIAHRISSLLGLLSIPCDRESCDHAHLLQTAHYSANTGVDYFKHALC